MSSRNATASWSGYAHQGKVGLLVALRKINELKCTGLNAYSLELETQEDAKIINGIEVIEVHQVKALMDTPHNSSYAEALGKFEACAGKNYLHTICQITNWATMDPVKNPKNVDLYPYGTAINFCELDKIDHYIFDEIKAILVQQAHEQRDNSGWWLSVFNEFLALLDNRIHKEHQLGNINTYKISFSLNELLSLVTDPPTNAKSKICAIRHRIYERYVEFVRNLNNLTYPPMTSVHEQFVVDIIEQICLLDDHNLEEFLIQIFPATTEGKTLSSCELSDDFFVTKDFSSTFLLTLISIDKQKLVLEDGSFPHYKADLNYLLTALQHMQVDCMTISQQILANKKLNTTRYETDLIINEHLTGKLSGYARKVIPRTGRFMDEKDIEFIPRVEAINKLN